MAKLKGCCEMLLGGESEESVGSEFENEDSANYFDDILESQVDVFNEAVGKVTSYGTVN